MATFAPEIDQAWNHLKESSIKWFTFRFSDTEPNKLIKDMEGTGDWEEFLSQFGPKDLKYAIFRAIAVDDESRRTKFIMVSWSGTGCSAMKRSKISSNKVKVYDMFKPHVDVQASEIIELSKDEMIIKLNSSTGAHKPQFYEL